MSTRRNEGDDMTDTRQALAALMGLAAECAQRKPLRAFEDFTEATHIGHRQFGRAYERADEDVRMLAVRLRAVFDALAPTLSEQPVAGAVAVDETLTWEKPPSAIEGRLGVWLTSGAELHPRTVNLVVRFARALASKLAAAEAKYGYSDGWASPDWMDECRAKLMEHIAKGDPRDVAAYCAFLWHHGASTARPEPSAQGRPCPFGCTTQEEHDAHQSAEPSAQGEPVAWVTEEMVAAYLTANEAYWKRIDGEPTKLGKWRKGTPSEATRVSLEAALGIAPKAAQPLK